MGCFSGPHKQYNMMTCIDYASGWRKENEENPSEKAMDQIQKEEIQFEKPDGCVRWSSTSNIVCQGNTVSKTTEMTYKFSDGNE